MEPNIRAHLLAAMLSVVVVWTVVIGALVLMPSAPGPRLSGNAAFNEKARWLRRHVGEGGCDVLVLGSSIALNSFDAASFAARWPSKIVNAGFWGMTPVDSRRVLNALLQICKPKLVIFPTFHGDFSEEQGSYDWSGFVRYIKGGMTTSIWTYLSNMDISYYALRLTEGSSGQFRERRMYQSLNFDSSGSVNFACSEFRISPQRWDGYRGARVPTAQPEKLAALGGVARLLSERGIAFVVAAVPMRLAGEQALDPTEMTRLWTAVAEQVTASGATLLRSRASDGYDDGLFVDWVHLNACGARKWTAELMDNSRSVIDRALSRHSE